MRYVFLIFFLAAIFLLVISVLHEEDPLFIAEREAQANPFTVVKDSQDVVWARAKKFIEEDWHFRHRYHLIKDSLIVVAYDNSYEKGDALRIEKSVAGDSARFYVQWWDSRAPQDIMAKEAALFMQRGIKRH